jgi:hypothetical protein
MNLGKQNVIQNKYRQSKQGFPPKRAVAGTTAEFYSVTIFCRIWFAICQKINVAKRPFHPTFYSGLPDFSWHNTPKRWIMIQIFATLPSDHKIYEMAVKYTDCKIYITTFSILRPSKNYPNWDFGFENIPSGNPSFTVAFFRRKKWKISHFFFQKQGDQIGRIFAHWVIIFFWHFLFRKF